MPTFLGSYTFHDGGRSYSEHRFITARDALHAQKQLDTYLGTLETDPEDYFTVESEGVTRVETLPQVCSLIGWLQQPL